MGKKDFWEKDQGNRGYGGSNEENGADVTWEAERKGDNIGEYGSLRR